MVADTGNAKLEILICHAQADAGFAAELGDGMAYDGRFKLLVASPSISEGRDSLTERGDLIAAADAVIFVLSSAGVASQSLQWEAGFAHELSKLMLTVRLEPLEGVAVPPALAMIDVVGFDGEHSFMEGLKALVARLPTDTGWLQDHTALSMRARQWQLAGKPEGHLLSSEEIRDAKNWTVDRPKWAPKPSNLHLEFISASESVELQTAPVQTAMSAVAAVPGREEQPKAAVEQPDDTQSLKKANRFYAAISILLAAAAGLAAWMAWTQQNKVAEVSKQIKAQEQIAELSKVTLAIQKERIEDAIKTVNASLCQSATGVANLLATTSDPAVWDINYDLFWTLYEGPMIALEQLHSTVSEKDRSLVADAMISFSKNLGVRGEPYEARAAGLPRPALLEDAANLTATCSKVSEPPKE